MLFRKNESKSSGWKVAVLAVVLICFGLSAVAFGAPPKKSDKKPPPKGPVLYDSVWKRVRPQRTASERKRARRVSAVAGVRGAKKEEGLKPYWKGEEKLPADLKEFSQISVLVNKSKYDQAATGFEDWINKYPKSKLAPRVKLSLGLCYAYLDKKEEAKKILTQWLKDYPKDPDRELVQQVVDDLSAGG